MTKISDKKIVRSRELGFVDAYFDANKDNLREDLINVSQGGFDIAFEVLDLVIVSGDLGQLLGQCRVRQLQPL